MQDLTFTPAVLEHAPVLPHSEGTISEITVINDTTVPIEFFSVDFDSKYIAEEDIMLRSALFATESVAVVPPREPGGSLQTEFSQTSEEALRPPLLLKVRCLRPSPYVHVSLRCDGFRHTRSR